MPAGISWDRTYLKDTERIIKKMAKTKKTEAVASPAPEASIVTEQPVAVVKPKVKKTKTTKPKAEAIAAPVEVEIKEEVVEEIKTEPVVEVKEEVEIEIKEEVVDTEVVAEEAEAEAEIVVDTDEVVVEDGKPVEKKKRKVVTKEKLILSIDELQKDLIPVLENGHKKLLKSYKMMIADVYRIMKIKTTQKKAKDATNSGFMRPVKPSVALEKFLSTLGDEDNVKPLTRAHLTTLICKYIKEKDLQNPNDRRIIFPDEELKTLFQITETDTEPLTYYNIQKRIQPHVSRIEETEVA